MGGNRSNRPQTEVVPSEVGKIPASYFSLPVVRPGAGA